jgi:outer membrane protein assembly factor BamB
VQYPKPYDIIALNTETHVVVLNRADGTLIRDIELPFPANAGGDTDGHSYIVASTRGWVYMVNLEAATVVPVFNPDSMSLVPIEVKRPNYYLATSDGKLYAREMRVTDDRESWARALSGAAGAAFEVTERTVVVPSIDNRVYAIDAATGGKAWDYPFITQGPCRTPVQVSEQTVFQYAEKDKFYAINLINGQQRWAKPEARLVAGLADGDVMLIDKDRRLMIVDELLGTVKHTVALTGFRFVAPNTRAPLVYAASSDGRVVAVSRVGMPRVRLEQLTGEK